MLLPLIEYVISQKAIPTDEWMTQKKHTDEISGLFCLRFH